MRHEDNTGPGQDLRSARCPETGTPGAGSGPGKRAGRKTGTAPRADFTTHASRAMAELIAVRDWLIVYQLPPYAPELNPVEAVWSHLKRSLANLAKRNLSQPTALVKTRLKRMQYRPGLLDGFLASTGLDLTPFCNPHH
jgi:DDE superfamily endonuclease